MIKKETFELMVMISEYYGNFTINQKKVDAWHGILRGFSFERTKENLLHFVSHSSIPPRISDLVQKSSAESRDIPNFQDTHVFLHTEAKPAQEKVVQERLVAMRKILRIERN